jgi:hypothetical protein
MVEAERLGAARSADRSLSRKRADLGAPVGLFFERQPPRLRPILDELRSLVEQAAPDAAASLKWGMPWYSIEGRMMCSITAHKAHVNLVLMGRPDAFPDPDGLLLGDGKGGRHLRMGSIDELPRERVRIWLETAAELARER